MADTNQKQYLDWAGLSYYDGKIKAIIKSGNDSIGDRLDTVEGLHSTKTVGEGDAAHEEFQTVAEEAANAVAAVVADAPEAFDTLKEIANWIQKDGETGFDAAQKITNLESSVGEATIKDEEGTVTKAGSGLTKRIEDLENINATADTYTAITNESIDALFEEEISDDNTAI